MRRLSLNINLILILCSMFFFVVAAPVMADSLVDTPYSSAGNPNKIDFKPVTDIPLLDNWTPGETINAEYGAANILNQIFSLSIQIGAMLAVFMFIWGGLNMIMARDNASMLSRGKEKMKNAIFGLLMLLSTFVVLNTINPDLVNISLFGGSTVRLNTTQNTIDYNNRVDQLYLDKRGSLKNYLACGIKSSTNNTGLECFETIEHCVTVYGDECYLRAPDTKTISYCYLLPIDGSNQYTSRCSPSLSQCENESRLAKQSGFNVLNYDSSVTFGCNITHGRKIIDLYGPTEIPR